MKIEFCEKLNCSIRIVFKNKSINNCLVRTTTQSYLKRYLKTFVPVWIKDLSQNWNFQFVAEYNKSTAYLSICDHFSEIILNTDLQFITYYNNSNTNLMLQPNMSIGCIYKWNISKTITKENSDVINCHFAVSGITSSIEFTFKIGLTALQCIQLLQSGQIFYPKSDVILKKELSTNSHSLLSPYAQTTTLTDSFILSMSENIPFTNHT